MGREGCKVGKKGEREVKRGEGMRDGKRERG